MSLENIYIVRHGYSEGNEKLSRHSDKPDHEIVLKPKGVVQANRAGSFLNYILSAPEHSNKKTVLFSSTYIRAVQTAYGIFEKLGIRDEGGKLEAFLSDERLKEQDFGEFSGLNKMEMSVLDNELQNIIRDPLKWYEYVYPGGESREQVVQRQEEFFEYLKAKADDVQNPFQNAIVVSHGVSGRALAKAALGKTIEEFLQEENPKNASIRHIQKVGDKYVDRGYIFQGTREEVLAAASALSVKEGAQTNI